MFNFDLKIILQTSSKKIRRINISLFCNFIYKNIYFNKIIVLRFIYKAIKCYEHTQKEDLRGLKDEEVSIKLRCYLITIVLFANR